MLEFELSYFGGNMGHITRRLLIKAHGCRFKINIDSIFFATKFQVREKGANVLFLCDKCTSSS